jgi:hypothetical protein
VFSLVPLPAPWFGVMGVAPLLILLGDAYRKQGARWGAP